MFLPELAVVFVGIVGNDSGRVDQQVHVMLQEQDVKRARLDAQRARVLARHGEASKAIVRELHADGVIGGELTGDAAHRTLRMVVYAADGAMKSLFEVPVSGSRLTRDEVAMLHANLSDDVAALSSATDEPARPPKREPKRTQVAAVEPKRPRPTEAVDEADIELEPTEHAAAPVDTAEVRPEDLMAATAAVETSEPAATDPVLRIGAAVGIGVTGRSFAPGPSTIAGYASPAVAALHFDAHVSPTTRTVLAVSANRTVEMTTPMADGTAATTMSRWEATAGFTLGGESLRVTPALGLGRRAFSIVSNDPSRSPDGSYDYLIAGATGSLALGTHVRVLGSLAFEPVFGGAEPTEMVLGEATRWALAAGAAVEVRPRAHLVVRAAADYQRFAWSWKMAGARGAGGAVDHYPSGTLSLGAEY